MEGPETIEIKYTTYLDIYWLTHTPHLVSERILGGF